ncbi:MAG: hypothetical protein UR96_C0021G0008 [candidate division WS6 bacterium GW2011_GWC1_36_11]|uniref:Uncharacterized protein n=3 Tax=Candidatus Dojkabacteria TaxID=74243 RepID=A0A0G0DSQ4_9BACT|nr:MAG: hypothetical protein UR96_C0021G0008 [candidate division WS6 bacterium GW2011_GWC1_36_11]KKQ04482.1 MAG: hypothetical protein US14_C0009G0003 [candidate division WS6 bacterium GW2011_WS6_36_26]KKQ11269.1 MAG: hypothetical protein US23_C0002G0007 [candidate division WS6 bacterium GW2011_GWE1_36_69]KKQ11869.1 MAG: hypothetical protein US24_C0012G0010 [candidate division WS6 bacterium GW2011_GWC2_36_7]KKQ17163.1 MAG: hypothetical protein US29_C0012G0003 [candidate division WS6 bacterium GW
MKNIASIFLLIALFAIPFATIVNAQDTETQTVELGTTTGDYTLETQVDDNTTRATNKYFDLTLSEGLQSPLDKSITYTLTIVPHVDSSKTQIIWDSSSTIKITPKHKEFVSVTKDGEFTYKATIKPTLGGTYNINATVISWQYDTNYTNTVNNSLELSNGLVSQPITPEYTILVVIQILVILGISGLAIWGGIELSKKFIKKTKVWLTPPR